ncbi:MAG: ribulose-phosphate 3-epimerase [Candidatus Omnitrophota bacterium]
MNIKIGASILSADFAKLGEEIRRIESAGIDLFHIDIMDGHFVPNITIGPGVLRDMRRVTKLPLDVHLMIEKPLDWAEQFISAGADMLTVHIEAINPPAYRRAARRLKSRGIKSGISLNPATPLARIEGLLDIVDFVLVMSVNPGFGGQKFIASALDKIKALRKIYNGDISVDGGINNLTAEKAIKAGANILACGTYLFNSKDAKETIGRIRCLG